MTNRRKILLALSLILTAVLLLRLPALGWEDYHHTESLTWGIAILSFLLALARSPRAFPWRAWLRQNRRLILAVAGLTLLALLLRTWKITSIPHTLGGDEGSQGLEALRVIEGKIRDPFATGWLGVPTMSFYFNSLSFRLLGRTVTALRLPWALIGTATVLATFLLVRRLKGTALALITAALLATYHYHIHFSRLGSNQIADAFFVSMSLLFIYRAMDGHRRLDWGAAGVVSGLALYFYAGSRLTLVVIAVVLAYALIRDPRGFLRGHASGILVMVLGFLIVAAPMMQFALRFPDEFNARLNQVGIIQSGWLDREVELRGESAVTILFDQLRRAALAFNYYPDRTVWYGMRQPLLGSFFGAVFLLGLGYAMLTLLRRDATSKQSPMVIWWWLGVILGGMLTESPPSSQRLITLSVPVCYFIALAMWELARLAHKAIHGVPRRALLVAATLIFALSSLKTYFLDFSPQRLYGGIHAELATDISSRLRRLSNDHRFYFVGAPWMYWGFATLPFLVPNADAVDVLGPVAELIADDGFLKEKSALFIVIPERDEELERIKQAFPNGEQFVYISPVDGRVMVTLYQVESPA